MHDHIIAHGSLYNKDWIDHHPDNWLVYAYDIIHRKSNTFLTTSCEITASMIQWKLGLRLKLTDCNFEEAVEHASVENATSVALTASKNNVFQISISEDWMYCDHILTIMDNYLIQSYYNQYTIKKTLLTSEIINAINNIAEPESYEIITGVKHTNPNWKIYYWV